MRMRWLQTLLFLGLIYQHAVAEELPTRLYVRTVPPGAKVVLDGKELGIADGLFIILPGDHMVTLELEGYSPQKRDVKVPAEHITRLVVTLVRREEPPYTHVGGAGTAPPPQPLSPVPPTPPPWTVVIHGVKGMPPLSAGPGPPIPPPPSFGVANPYTESRGADMPIAMHDFLCSDVLNGMIYTFGGNRGGDSLVDSIFVYDVKKDTWREATGKMPYAYCASGATMATAVWGNKVYITPGLGPNRNNGWGQHERIIEFDPSTETACEKAGFGASAWCVSPVTIGDCIYWFGASGIGQEHKIWRYAPSSDSIKEVSRLAGRGREVCAIVGKDGYVYLFGRNPFERFDPKTNTCALCPERIPDSAGPHVWPGAGSLIHLFGPMHNPSLFSYDTATGVFSMAESTYSFARECDGPTRSYDPATGRVFFFGGRRNGIWEEPFKSTYVLTPKGESR